MRYFLTILLVVSSAMCFGQSCAHFEIGNSYVPRLDRFFQTLKVDNRLIIPNKKYGGDGCGITNYGAICYQNDTFFVYKGSSVIYNDTNWVQIAGTGGGGISEVVNYWGTIIHGGNMIEVDSFKLGTRYWVNSTFQPIIGYTTENVANKIGTGGAPSSTTYYHAAAVNTLFSNAYSALADSVLGRQKYSDTLTFDVTLAHLNVILAGYITHEVDPVFTASPSFGITNGNISNWNVAYNKYITSTGFSAGVLTLTKNDASTLTQSLDGRYQLFSDTASYDITVAHLNVILAGYLTTEVDPIFTASPAYGITNGNIANWNVAYNKYVTAIGFSSGTLTLTKNDATTLTQSLDGRYILYSDTSSWSVTLAHLNTILTGYVTTSRTISTTAPLSGGGDLSANRTLSITQAGASTDGYLSSIHWNLFNGKQDALNGTGFVKITGTTISYDNNTYLTSSAANAVYTRSITLTSAGVIYNSPINFTNNGSGLFTGSLTMATQSPHTFLAGDVTSTLTPTFRLIVASDLPSFLAYTNQNNTWTKTQAGAISVLTYSTTLTPDFSQGNAMECVLTSSVTTLGTPTNITEGQNGVIDFYQDETGNRVLSGVSWAWNFQGGVLPIFTTTAKHMDYLTYKVRRYRTSAVTMTIANPGVVTWTNHGLYSGMKIQFTTTGALPTGVTANTTYWVIRLDANTFKIETALANTAGVNFTGSQSGTHTATCIMIDAGLNNDPR